MFLILQCCLCGLTAVTACRAGSPQPAELDTRNDACASCRMAVSDPKLAAQIVVAGEEPRFFDDLGCLQAFVRDHTQPAAAAIFVADHRTGSWIPAATAVYTRVDRLDTPMQSHLVAHADDRSRDADAVARGGAPVEARQIVGGAR